MLTKGFLKPQLSIEKLGKRRFWTGIALGVLFAFVLSYLLNYSRESLRMITFMGDPFILTEKEFRLYDLFFAAFSTSFGFGVTIIWWLRGRNKNIRKKYRATFAITTSFLIIFVALMVVARFGSLFPIILYGLHGYDGHLDFLHEFGLLLVLIPVFVFFAQWNAIRMIFATKYRVMLSVLFFAMIIFCIYETTYVNRNILNQSYYTQNRYRFDYIDAELDKARNHGVIFDDTIRQILRKKYAERTTGLVMKLKHAFETDGIVPLDSLVLEKIVIHNMNRHQQNFIRRHEDQDVNWPYALPENIYRQILKHDVNSQSTEVLFQILSEEASLVAMGSMKWSDRDKFSTPYEREKLYWGKNLMNNTVTIQSRLIQVVDKLKSDSRYRKYHNMLPDLEFDNHRGRQKFYELNMMKDSIQGI